jgi:hypothetical protein
MTTKSFYDIPDAYTIIRTIIIIIQTSIIMAFTIIQTIINISLNFISAIIGTIILWHFYRMLCCMCVSM